jgi:hypothetical protein
MHAGMTAGAKRYQLGVVAGAAVSTFKCGDAHSNNAAHGSRGTGGRRARERVPVASKETHGIPPPGGNSSCTARRPAVFPARRRKTGFPGLAAPAFGGRSGTKDIHFISLLTTHIS